MFNYELCIMNYELFQILQDASACSCNIFNPLYVDAPFNRALFKNNVSSGL